MWFSFRWFSEQVELEEICVHRYQSCQDILVSLSNIEVQIEAIKKLLETK